MTKPMPTTGIQIHVYAPTSAHPEEVIDAFYEQLQQVKESVKEGEFCVIMDDFNAKVGKGSDKVCGIAIHR